MYLIFGGSGGVGSALARKLSADGQVVRVVGRTVDALSAVASEVRGTFAVADAEKEDEVEEVFKSLPKDEPLLGVINCVGSLLLKPAHTTTFDQWSSVISANLTSAFLITKHAARTMMQQRHGTITLVSSAAAELGMANHEAIAAAKGGVAALTRSAAASYARYGIRVNAVAPGLVDSPLTQGITSSAAQMEASIAMHPLGRIGSTDEVAEAIMWLATNKSAWVTGQVIGVDGGLSRVRSRN